MSTQTLIVRRVDFSIEAVVNCNAKSRAKSIEQDELWVVDPQTARVLPYRGGGQRFDQITLLQGAEGSLDWYEATVIDETTANNAGLDRITVKPPESIAAANSTGSQDDTAAKTGAQAANGEPDTDVFLFLAELSDTVAERRISMPAGSYTTHLFTQGEGKVRKKTGEEAIELVLAANNEEITSEAADLLYHMMVLLEIRELSLRNVVEELRSRHS